MDAARFRNPDYWLRLFSIELLALLVVVLIFYLIVMPMPLDVPFLLELPPSTAGVKSPDTERDIAVAILRDGRVILSSQPITVSKLTEYLSSRADAEPAVVRIRVDRKAPFGAVRGVIVAARDAGCRQVTFMVARPDSVFY